MRVTREAATQDELDALEELIDKWLETQKQELPILREVVRDADIPRRWYVRLEGEARDVSTVWLTLGQRTLKYETYFLPAPENNREKLFELLLRRNYELVGAQFGIGPEEAIFLTGELPFHAVDEHELDRILGSIWEFVERHWSAVLRIGFTERLKNNPNDGSH
ncbi:MAG TPA: hypothetical protein EYG17_07735 [Acidimicrobiia bacterium]|nr:hypothetical protein [Acidimicrobiia bacterium]HIL05926.1 hypothetical protein [Acidimicrobiia bacterium]